MILEESEYLEHYGILRKSGRYPWGSGNTQSARNATFLDVVAQLTKEGMSHAEIAKMFSTREHPLTSTDIRRYRTIAISQQREELIRTATRLKDKGMSPSAIGRQMGKNESSIRALLAPGAADKINTMKATTDMLRRQIADKGYIDVGSGVELHLQITRDKLDVAIAQLKGEGYKMHYVKVPQLGTDKDTSHKILGAPNSKYPKLDQVRAIDEHSEDGGRTHLGIHPPMSISSKRIGVRYAEDGGADADGVIYVRPGVPELNMGPSRYSQVRIAVDGTHFMKGMAVYKDGLPEGTDLVFNTNKHDTGNKLDAMKPLKDDPDNPFGSVIRQIVTPDGKKLTSAMNIVNDEDDWNRWSKSLSSQVLSKQAPKLAKDQLAMLHERHVNELNEIMALTNPAIKKRLLESFADSTDKASVHLKAAALPGQATHVILPVNSLKQHEIYAPNYNNGDRVALIRYPHGGKFEIPELTVNNKNREGKKLIGDSPKSIAVGIHHKVAERMSGADFDGDTVLVIPNHTKKIDSNPPLEGLKGFDPVREYKIPAGSSTPLMKASNKQREMGDITNLIADMTIKGANTEELARAIRHSMVVIDAEKHGLDYKASSRNNGIPALKKRYQGREGAGASTLITRAKSKQFVPHRKERLASEGGPIDPRTGEKVFTPTGRSYVNAKGQTVLNKTQSTKLAEAKDAFELSSGTNIEALYAQHSNRLKALANEARKESLSVPKSKTSESAKKVYADEVASLNDKLRIAKKNAPLERRAQRYANIVVRQKRAASPDMEKSDVKKIKNQALIEGRIRMGAKKTPVEILPREWEAIQAGAISNHKLSDILDNADLDKVKQLATPRHRLLMTSSKKNHAKALLALGYTQAEVARQLGVSVSTLKANL